jgi:hypothetical protein
MAIGGTGAIFRVRDGGQLTMHGAINLPVNTEGNAVVNVNTDQPILFGDVSASSTVTFGGTAETIPVAHFGNLKITESGTIKRLSAGTTTVAGNFTVDRGVTLDGDPDRETVLAVAGTVKISDPVAFIPAHPFRLRFEKSGSQLFELRSERALFQEIVVSPGAVVEMSQTADKVILTLGTESGGGLTVNTGGKLILKQNDLRITGKGAINGENQAGEIGFSKSSLSIESSAAKNSLLYTVEDSDSLMNLTIQFTGPGKLSIQRPIYVTNSISATGGKIVSNGFVNLVSGATRTASVFTYGEGASIEGEVHFQRWIRSGAEKHYICLPVSGVSVRNLQQSVPVTGTFEGASNGNAGRPSLFYHDDLTTGWVPYPHASNLEFLETGRGYSISIPDPQREAKIIVSGELQEGNYTYALSGNAGNVPQKGWNLIGNPYAAPIRWDVQKWISKGVQSTAYVLDERYPGGRFLVWDGDVGDEEFSGLVAQGQGFFVRTIAESAALQITESAKADSSSTAFFRQQRKNSLRDVLVIALRQNELVDKAYVKFTANGVSSFDEGDGVKRSNGYFSLSTFSTDSVALSINNFDESFCDQSIPLSIDETSPGTYEFTFGGSLFAHTPEIKLADHFTDTMIKINENAVYGFQVTTDPRSYGRKRFHIEMPAGSLEDPAIILEDNILRSNVSTGNQWLLEGEEIEGATGATYTPLVSGAYTLRISSGGCSKVSPPLQVTVTITDIFEEKDKGLSVYPNPASEFIRIQSVASAASPVYYSLTNGLGLEIRKGEIEAAEFMQGAVLDVRQLPPGMYFLKLQSAERNFAGKFIIE